MRMLDVRTRTASTLELGLAVAIRPLFDSTGRRLLFLGADSALAYASFGGLKVFTLDLLSGAISTVMKGDWSISAAAWTPTGDSIVVAGARNGSLTVPSPELWIVGADGSDPRCRTNGCDGVVGLRMHHDMPTWNTSQEFAFVVPHAEQAFATLTHHGKAEILRISLEGSLDFEPVIYGDRSCLIVDACIATSELLFCASDMCRPWELCIAEMTGRNEREIASLNSSAIDSWPELKTEHLTVTSPDGISFEGWHLARRDREAPQPTVMFIHGGPFLSVGHIFRFDFHLLASNGFAVLFANFRGSVGYGNSFSRAIMGDWGARGYLDHMSAAETAVSRGMADPDHLGVWGASHGGFATAWIVGHTTRFRAAVAESSITNFSTLYYLSDDPDVFARDLGGRPDEIPEVYRSHSPLAYAACCRTPTLLLHGENDLRCPMAEAEQFYRALHDANCVTELVIVPGMTHIGDSIGPLAARKGQNEALLDWFQRYL
jgi:dipeptidyl aminopeptidase/acylaminoacyl peptidase